MISHADALERIDLQLKRGRALPNLSINDDEDARSWYDYTMELLRQICSTDELRDDFAGIGGFGTDISIGNYLRRLRSIRDRLELLPVLNEAASRAPQQGPADGPATASRSVFVVHGHDDGAKETVARYLSKLGLN